MLTSILNWINVFYWRCKLVFLEQFLSQQMYRDGKKNCALWWLSYYCIILKIVHVHVFGKSSYLMNYTLLLVTFIMTQKARSRIMIHLNNVAQLFEIFSFCLYQQGIVTYSKWLCKILFTTFISSLFELSFIDPFSQDNAENVKKVQTEWQTAWTLIRLSFKCSLI